MKLLTRDAGWAATKTHLFWTGNGGLEWKDITPRSARKWQAVSSEFFLDQSNGWVVLNCGDHRSEDIDRRNDPDDTCFEVASTTNGGIAWSFAHPKVIDPDPEAGFSGQSYVGFADRMHGWMILKVSRSTAVSFGVMYGTEDGGKTWKLLPQPPVAEPFRFVTPKEGWLSGGPNHDLYVTRDGGNRWQAVSLQKPNQVGVDRGMVYDLPVFGNASDGFLPVRYKMGSELESPTTTVVLFATNDGGSTWTLDRIQPKLSDPTDGWLPVSIADSTLVAGTISTGHISLMQTARGGGSKNQSAKIPVRGQTVDQLSFVNPQRGWILAGCWLLSTSDGGAAWTDVTPDPGGTRPPATSPSRLGN